MEKLRVKCIVCGTEWTKESSIDWGPDHISSSLCTRCFVQVASATIHKKQLKDGNFGCFGKAEGYCTHWNCRYARWCLHKEEIEQCDLRIEEGYEDAASMRGSL
jgi:hypothetical protein